MRRLLVAVLTLATAVPAVPALPEPEPPSTEAEAGEATEGAEAGEDGAREGEEPVERVFRGTVEVLGDQPERADTVTVLDAREIETRRAPVAFDALDKEPGLFLRSRLGMSGAGLTRLNIRGIGAAGPAGLGVFVDGRPDATVSFAHPTPSAHTLEGVERIEVTHGPSPVLDGAGLTGVVRIVTGEPAPGTHGVLQSAAGSHGTTESSGLLTHGWDGGYLRVSGGYRATDGHNPESDARAGNGHVKLGLDLSDRWQLSLSAGRNQDHFSVFGPFFVPGPFSNPGTEDLDLTQTVADVTLRGTFDRWQGSVKLWHDDLDPESQNLRPGVSRAKVSESGVRLRAVLPGTRHRLIVGLDALTAEAENTPGLPPGRPAQDESLSEVGPYVFLERSVGERATLLGGVRLVDHSEYGTEPVGELGVTWALRETPGPSGPRTRLRARATRGYQSPTLQELYGVFLGGRAGPANTELGPELMNQYELGLNHASGEWSLDVVAFLQEGEDLIQRVGPALRNAGDFSHPGVEARFEHRAGRGVSWGLGVTALDLETGVLGVPEQTVDLLLEVAPPAWQSRDVVVTLLGRWADGYRDQPAPAAPVRSVGSYFVADLKIMGRIAPGLHGYVEVENVTDEEYEIVAGIPMPGLVALAGLRVGF